MPSVVAALHVLAGSPPLEIPSKRVVFLPAHLDSLRAFCAKNGVRKNGSLPECGCRRLCDAADTPKAKPARSHRQWFCSLTQAWITTSLKCTVAHVDAHY